MSAPLDYRVATLAAPQAAQARIFMATNGGSACKPAFGASTKFNFTEYYALNNGTPSLIGATNTCW